MNDPEKKIIIDEDWKTQIEREKEELAAQQASPSGETESGAADIGPEPDLPPASFAFIVSTMVAQTMAAMGQLPDPVSGKPEIRLKFAKHHIDTLLPLDLAAVPGRLPASPPRNRSTIICTRSL